MLKDLLDLTTIDQSNLRSDLIETTGKIRVALTVILLLGLALFIVGSTLHGVNTTFINPVDIVSYATLGGSFLLWGANDMTRRRLKGKPALRPLTDEYPSPPQEKAPEKEEKGWHIDPLISKEDIPEYGSQIEKELRRCTQGKQENTIIEELEEESLTEYIMNALEEDEDAVTKT